MDDDVVLVAKEDRMPSNSSSSWKASDADHLRASLLHIKALEILPAIAACLRGTRIHTDSYAYTHRVKTVERILDKVRRRRVDDGVHDYDVDRVTDILGLRVITLFNEDLHPIAMEMLSIALGDLGLLPNPLLAHKLRQIRIYTTAPVDNPTTSASRLARKISDRLKRTAYADLEVEVSYRSDYSSIHMVLDVEHNGGTEEPTLLPIEIQIRTVFEDTWSRIDHVLRYSRSRQKRTADAKNVPVASERHLITLKALLDACSSFAETIREEMSAQASSPTITIVSVQSDFERTANFLGIDASVRSDVLELLREKQALDAIRKAKAAETGLSSRENEELAERFGVMAEKISKKVREWQQPGAFLAPDKLSGSANQFALYTLRMEEAYCRTVSDQADEQKQAQRIYRELADVFPDVPILLLRWGQASVKVGDYDVAMRAYERALKSFEARFELPLDDEMWDFSEEQRTYISQMLHRVYGYACWKKFDSVEQKNNDAIAALRKAWDLTAQGMRYITEIDGKLRSINNLLSYFEDMSRLDDQHKEAFADLLGDQAWLSENYKVMREGVDVDTEERLQIIDTMVVIAARIGDDAEAKRAASRAVTVALQEGAAERFGREVTDAALRHAWSVLRMTG